MTHVVGVAEVTKNEEFGDIFRATMEKWAKPIKYVAIDLLKKIFQCYSSDSTSSLKSLARIRKPNIRRK